MNTVLKRKISQITILRQVAIVRNFSYYIEVNSIFRCSGWLILRQIAQNSKEIHYSGLDSVLLNTPF